MTTDSFPFWCCIFLQSHRDCDAAVWPFLLIWKLMPGSLELYSVLYCIDLLRWSFHHEVMLDIHKFQILITFKRWNFSPYLNYTKTLSKLFFLIVFLNVMYTTFGFYGIENPFPFTYFRIWYDCYSLAITLGSILSFSWFLLVQCQVWVVHAMVY